MSPISRGKSWTPRRIAIDTMIVDQIAASPEVLPMIHRIVRRRAMVLIVSHIIRDQLLAINDTEKRDQLIGVFDALPKEFTPTRGFVMGVSTLGEARLGDGAESGVPLQEVTTRGRGAIQDALIATTASGDADVLVTEDGELRTKVKLSSAHCEVWDFEGFRSFLRSQESL